MDVLFLKMLPWMIFDPPEDKVIDYFLRAKITGDDELVDFIPEAQSCKWEPWDLKIWLDSCGKTKYNKWWFFSPLDLKHRSGNRSNRATNAGFWKVTGNDKIIMSDLGVIGKKKFLVFYRGRGKGEKTNWVIHEYHMTLKDFDGTHPGQNVFVLCRLSYKHEKGITDPNINDAGPAVSSPAVSKSFHEESESEPLLASVFPASDVEATKTTENCDETISGTTTAVKCDEKHVSAHAAENQLGELTTINTDLEIEKMIIELQQVIDGDALKPSTSPHNNPTVSSDTTAKSYLEGLQSVLDLDLVSPQECFDGKTLNTIPLSVCNHKSYNACAARKEVPKATASEDLNLDYLNGNIPNMFGSQENLTLESIKDNGSCDGPDGLSLFELSFEPPDGVYDLATYGHEFQDLNLDYLNGNIPNMFGSQENIPNLVNAPDLNLDYLNGNIPNMFGSQENLTLESIKDNGSWDGPDGLSLFELSSEPPDGVYDLATYGHEFQDLNLDYLNGNIPNMFGSQENILNLANAPVSGSSQFESTIEDSGEISQKEASSGLRNLGSHMVWIGGSSNQIEGSDCISKN
ncbi:hypothetical protein I3842_05G201500 [Carya illinoinensis]|uniref:NAC domain-containing protein n=1 Tax=Carya illinoinensis TaxID=32201 RepID=A0A922F548_CARIL|nr:hypothetical protein I3842_05G201500 [Carya illinoinensis]